MLRRPRLKEDLVREMGGVVEPQQHSPLNPDVLIVPAAGPRKTPFATDPDTDRDKLLRRALAYLSRQNVEYVPFDVEEDIQASYEDDTFEEFRETVWGWVRALAKEAA